MTGSRVLYRTLYCSRSVIPADSLPEQVDFIIRRSIANNRARAITGLLFIHQDWFVQALEGPADTVQATFDRITTDPRHAALKVISTGPAEGRLFSDWDMCARTLSMADQALIDAFERRGPFDPARLTPAAALKLLTTLRTVRQDAQLRYVA